MSGVFNQGCLACWVDRPVCRTPCPCAQKLLRLYPVTQRPHNDDCKINIEDKRQTVSNRACYFQILIGSAFPMELHFRLFCFKERPINRTGEISPSLFEYDCVRLNWVAALEIYIITKTYLYNFDPLKPHFYIAKLGFTGVYNILLISAQNIDCGYSLEPPRQGGSNEYPQSMFWAEI